MAVRIRMKRMGRKHRAFFRICATDARSSRDGRVIEELGYYDPMVKETDARAVLNGPRVDYWLSVGAQPSDKVAVLIKKYGSQGTHLEQQHAALERLKIKPQAPAPVAIELPQPAAAEAAADSSSAAAADAEVASEEASDAQTADEVDADEQTAQ